MKALPEPPEPAWRTSYPDEQDSATASATWGKVIAELRARNPAALAKRHCIVRLVEACVIYDRGAREIAAVGGACTPHTGSPQANRTWAMMRSASALCAAREVDLGLSPLRRLPNHRSAEAYLAPRWLDRAEAVNDG